MNFEKKIKELNINLPEAKPPVGSYVATKKTGNLLFISGQISIDENGELIKGKVGKDLSTDQAYEAAKRCGLSLVAQAKAACDGDLSKIKWPWVLEEDDAVVAHGWGGDQLGVKLFPTCN